MEQDGRIVPPYKKEEMSEAMLQRRLRSFKSNPKYVAQNMYLFRWESDFLCKMKSGYWVEVECKISVSDFKKDFEKIEKHEFFKLGCFWKYRATKRITDEKELADYDYPGNRIVKEGKTWMVYSRCQQVTQEKRPNYFWYCVPWYMADDVEPLVPEYAGLVVMDEIGILNVRKKAPLLHTDKYSDSELNIAEKYFYHWLHLLQSIEQKRHEAIIKRLRNEVSFLKAEYKAATGYDIKEVF